MTPDFIDLHYDLLVKIELCGAVAFVAFILGEMVGYARAERDRLKNIRLFEKVTDCAQKGKPFDADNS